jgi:hypothetical protein
VDEKGTRFNVIAITVALLVIFSFPGKLLAQELYRWLDDKKIIHFSDNFHSIPEKYRRDAEKDSLRLRLQRQRLWRTIRGDLQNQLRARLVFPSFK